jgi:hypothetical protein
VSLPSQSLVENNLRLLTLDKLNLYAMPAQDAMELGEFLATVQVKMDRFLPGEAASG